MKRALTQPSRIVESFYTYGLYLVFLMLVVTFSVLNPRFYSLQNVINLLQQSTVIGVAAVGAVFILLTAGIDLSIGTNIFISATMLGLFLDRGLPPAVTLGAVILLCGFIGALNGFIISILQVVPIIATLASMFFVRGIGLVISKQSLIIIDRKVADAIMLARIAGIPVIVYVFALVVIVGQIILSSTVFGRTVYAVGNNATAAQKTGINVRRIRFLVYIIGGLLFGLSGILSAVQVGSISPAFGKEYLFVVISSCVLGGVSLFGGKGNVFPGAFIGVLIITAIENGMVLINANPYAYEIVRGIVIFLAVVVDSIRNKGELR